MPDSPLTTGVDALIDLVDSKGTISFSEAAAQLRVPLETVEAWARFLEEENMLKISYSFTKPFLVSVKAVAPKAAPATKEQKKAAPPQPPVPQQAATPQPVTQPQVIPQALVQKQAPPQKAAPLAELQKVVVPPPEPQEAAAPAPQETLEPQETPAEPTRPAEFDELMKMARASLAKGDVTQAQQIYEKLEKNYTPEVAPLESIRDEHFLEDISEPDKESQELASTIRDYLSEVQVRASRGEIDDAVEAFSKASSCFNKIEPSDAELHLSLTPLLAQAQQTLIDAELAHASKDKEEQLARVDALLGQIDTAMQNADIDKAFALYDQLDAAKKAMQPIETRTDIEHKMLPIYDKLITTHLELTRKEVESKLEMLRSVCARLDDALLAKDQQQARQMYEVAKRVYLAIPDEFFERKVEAQRTLLSYAKRISDLELGMTRETIMKKISRIGDMIDAGSAKLRRKDVESAKAAYIDAITEFSKLPKGFLEIKAPIRKKFVQLYTALTQQGSTITPPSVAASAAPMVMLPEPDLARLRQETIKSASTVQDTGKRWRQAITDEQWEEAIAIADSADNGTPEGRTMQEKGSLLKEAVGLAGASTEVLHTFYAHYNQVVKDYPGDVTLYRYIRSLYIKALER